MNRQSVEMLGVHRRVRPRSGPHLRRRLGSLAALVALVAGGVMLTPVTAHAANLASAVTFSVNVDDGKVTASGWAVDWGNTSAALDVAFISGSTILAGARANGPRPELAAYGIPGWHGFTSTFFAASTGTTTICLVVIPAGGGPGQLASCHDVTVPPEPQFDNPQGFLFADVDTVSGAIVAEGVAFDLNDENQSISVMVTLDGTPIWIAAAHDASPDLVAAGISGKHAFTRTFFAPSFGAHSVCLFAFNIHYGHDQLLECVDVTVTADPERDDPRGDIMAFQDPDNGRITVYGWAFDANDIGRSVWVTLTDNGTAQTGMLASLPSPELEPFGVPGRHALLTSWLPTTPGTHEICQFVTNVGYGKNALTACATVEVVFNPARDNPRVALETSTIPGQLIVKGWAFDPNDMNQPRMALVQVDGNPATRAFSANEPYPALAAYGVPGNHGFSGTIALTAGTHQVCVTADNWGPGYTPPFGDCRQVVINAPVAAPKAAFTVSQDPATGKVTVAGWAYDPTSPTSPVYVMVGDGVMSGVGTTANQPYPALAAYGIPGNHGFSITGMPFVSREVSVCLDVQDLPSPSVMVRVECKKFTILTDAARDNARHSLTITGSPGAITVSGWVFDPNDTSRWVYSDVTIDGATVLRGVPANLPSPELYPFGIPGDHRLSLTIPVSSGSHNVCLTPQSIGLTDITGLPLVICHGVVVP
jgi:hypothetical protein